MQLCAWMPLVLFLTVDASLREVVSGPSPGPVDGSQRSARPSSEPLMNPALTQDPPTLRSLQQELLSLHRKVDAIASIVTSTKGRVDQSVRSLEHLMRYFIKTSCADVVMGPAESPLLPATGAARPDLDRQASMDGVFAIFPPTGSSPKRVKCESSSAGDPGWTVVLLRRDGSVHFNRSSGEYKAGFGDPSGEVWIGLDTLHDLTAARPQQLRVEMKNFAGKTAYAQYKSFSIGGAAEHYKLVVEGYDPQGTAGDALKDHNGMVFSTVDDDRDTDVTNNCAAQFGSGGGWWYARCYVALGTGQYRVPARAGLAEVSTAWGGVTWHPFSDVKKSLKEFKMLIKPQDE